MTDHSLDLAEWCADGSHEGRPPMPQQWADPDLTAVPARVWDVCRLLAVALDEGDE